MLTIDILGNIGKFLFFSNAQFLFIFEIIIYIILGIFMVKYH
jgi:hypothetical protein